MAEMNLSTEQVQNHRHREETGSCQGGRVLLGGWNGRLGLVDVSFYT